MKKIGVYLCLIWALFSNNSSFAQSDPSALGLCGVTYHYSISDTWDFDEPLLLSLCDDTNVTYTMLSTVTNVASTNIVCTNFVAIRAWKMDDACNKTAYCTQKVYMLRCPNLLYSTNLLTWDHPTNDALRTIFSDFSFRIWNKNDHLSGSNPFHTMRYWDSFDLLSGSWGVPDPDTVANGSFLTNNFGVTIGQVKVTFTATNTMKYYVQCVEGLNPQGFWVRISDWLTNVVSGGISFTSGSVFQPATFRVYSTNK